MASIASVQEYQSSHLLEGKVAGGFFTPVELQAFLDRASQYLESLCYQPLRATNEVETWRLGTHHACVDTHGILVMTPRFFPVTLVNSIKLRTDTFSDWATLAPLSPMSYSVQDIENDLFTWGAMIEMPNSPVPRKQWGEVQCDYNHGFGEASMPDDLKEACIMVAYAMITVGFAVIEMDTSQVHTLIPSWMWGTYVKPTLTRYTRRF